MEKADRPRQKEILEVMRATGCDRRTARRALVASLREVRIAYAMLIDALCRGEIRAVGINTETGKQENIPLDYWSSVS